MGNKDRKRVSRKREKQQHRAYFENRKSVNVKVLTPLAWDLKIDMRLVKFYLKAMRYTPNIDWGFAVGHFIDVNRNSLIKTALDDPNTTHIFFVDSDTIPPPDAIKRLLAHDKDVIAGVSPLWSKTELAAAWNVVREGSKKVAINELPEKPFKALAIGGSTILIKRTVLEKIEPPYFKVLYREDGSLKVSEDLYFSYMVRKAGFDLWVDPSIKCGHNNPSDLLDWVHLLPSKQKKTD